MGERVKYSRGGIKGRTSAQGSDANPLGDHDGRKESTEERSERGRAVEESRSLVIQALDNCSPAVV